MNPPLSELFLKFIRFGGGWLPIELFEFSSTIGASGWEMRFTEDHVRYFVDHNTRSGFPLSPILVPCNVSNFMNTGQRPSKTRDPEVPKRVQKEPMVCLLSMRDLSGEAQK